jgi:ATP-binding cassette subfamily F protein 3
VLRGLATQVWELRDQQLIPFPGSFVEWEAVRAENKAKTERDARAVSAAASEKASVARAATQKAQNAAQKNAAQKGSTAKTVSNSGGHGKPPASGDARKAARQAEKALADAELLVNTLEAKIAELTRQLEDVSLYDTPDGVMRAQKMGQQLDTARESLDAAMHDWSVAAEQKQAIGKA